MSKRAPLSYRMLGFGPRGPSQRQFFFKVFFDFLFFLDFGSAARFSNRFWAQRSGPRPHIDPLWARTPPEIHPKTGPNPPKTDRGPPIPPPRSPKPARHPSNRRQITPNLARSRQDTRNHEHRRETPKSSARHSYHSLHLFSRAGVQHAVRHRCSPTPHL